MSLSKGFTIPNSPQRSQTSRRFQIFLLSFLGVIASATVAFAAFPTDAPNDPRFQEACTVAPCPGAPTGQWNLYPGSGISAKEAWKVTLGRADVVAAILDSGVDYDHEDLRNKIWLNQGELPVPTGPDCVLGSDPHDCNADGVFSVKDYIGDPRVTDFNDSAAVDRGDFRVFNDGLDNDGNGYVDDLSGWDSDDNDGDEFDHRFFGHGTGRAGILAPETNNLLGVAGVCPRCPMMNVRIDDTFVCNSEGVAKGAIYAIDNGAKVINMSLGCTTASRLSRSALDYATSKNVLAFNASANEFSTHQNFQSIFDDVITVGAVTHNSPDDPSTSDPRGGPLTTFLQKASFSNYGAHLDVVAPTLVPGAGQGLAGLVPNHAAYTWSASGTSSSTPHGAGVGALVFSRARDLIETGALPVAGLALQDISTQEVRQIINQTADDVTAQSGTTYPVSAEWDKWTGYGRINAKKAVDLVAAATMPPEADINSPDWYTLVDGVVPVRFYANARWATSYAYTLEFARGVEPTSWTTLASVTSTVSDAAVSSANRLSNFTIPWPTAALANGLYTLRLRVTDGSANANKGEDRMAVWVRHPDAQDQPGFPKVFDGSLESLSVATVDLDSDNKLEIIFADGNGEVHAIKSDGSELAGFPVHADVPLSLPLATSDAFDLNPANGEVALSYAPIIGGPAVGDIDRDGVQEIVVAATNGKVYCWNADASVCSGFPVATDPGFSRDPYPPHSQIENSHPEGIGATPALGDLDGDGKLEIVVGSIDQKLYAWNSEGDRFGNFPKQIFDAGSAPSGVSQFAPRAILSSAAIANVDGVGFNDIVVGTNETYSTPAPPGTGGSGRAYLIRSDGTIAPNWPVKPTSLSPSAVPLVAEGVTTSPVLADIDGDGKLESALTAFIGDATIYRFDGSTFSTMSGSFGATGPGSLDLDETTPEGGLPNAADQPSHFYVANGAFGDIDGDGSLEYMAGSVGNRLVAANAQPGTFTPFDHLLSVWNASNGSPKPAFPRVIEDWQFLNSPSVADLNGDGMTEVIDSSGGFFVHAFNRLGQEPAGWPKNTGQWQTSGPSIGDIDGDGDVEVVQTTRLGSLFVWSAPESVACQKDEWRKFRHDEWNTGNYHADTRRPAKIDMPVLSDAGDVVSLRWTAVGDDGKCDKSTSYELRTSSAPITEGNFENAAPVPTASPKAAGSPESLTFYLTPGTQSLALRAVDEAGNRGPLVVIAVDETQIFAKKYVPLVRPVRILDTRDGTGGALGPLGPDAARDIQVGGVGGVPENATAVVMNVTAVDPSESSHFTVYPTGLERPTASNLNFGPGQTIANLVVVELGSAGKVSVYNSAGEAHVIFDVAGWVSDGTTDIPGGGYTPVAPARILDSRLGTGGPIGPGEEFSVAILGEGGFPATGVSGVVLNVTAVDATAPGYFTVYPNGQTRPLASNINFVGGQTVPNLVFVRLGAQNKVNVFNSGGNTHVIFDVAGWLSDGSTSEGGSFEALSPFRILDTRYGTGGFTQAVGPGESISVPILGKGGIPTVGVSAVVMNVTAVDPTQAGYLTLYPTEPKPFVSNLNFVAGQTVPNLVVVKVGPGGRVELYNSSGNTDVIFDVAGWFTG